MESVTYEPDYDEKHVPFTASPLDAWRGARKPIEPERKPKAKTKKTRKAVSVGPVIRREGPITLDFK